MRESAFLYFQSLDKHDFFAHLYKNYTEADEIASRFILEGLIRNEKIYFVSDKGIPDKILIRLYNNNQGIRKETVRELLKWIKITPAGGSEIFLYSSFMRQARESIISEFKRSERRSLSRLIINKRPSLHESSITFDIRTSAEISSLCNKLSVILMYQFKLDKISSEDLLNIMKSNPRIIENDYVHDSPFYIDPSKIDISDKPPGEISELLTAQEQKILRGIVNGLSNKAIADNLSLSPRTVETHRANIMKKLDVNNLVDLVKFAIKKGFI